jgi:hypothetical protein
MAQCPQCQSAIEISESHYGTLFNCPKCQAVFFVGWDGNPEQPQMQGGSAAVGLPPLEMPTPTEPQQQTQHEPEASVETPVEFSPGPSGEMQTQSAVQVDPSPGFQDVVDYGNTTELRSNLTYTIAIEGIEIADIREKFKEAITDARFGWDVETILKQIDGGKITFYDLSPAKAVALINRIKYMPIRISWRQNALS